MNAMELIRWRRADLPQFGGCTLGAVGVALGSPVGGDRFSHPAAEPSR